MNIFADLAPKYWEIGISVMPVMGKGDCERGWERWCKSIPTEEEQERLVKYKSNYNISLLTGDVSGVIAIDVDLYKGTEDFDKINAVIPYTMCAKIGQKGITYFFKGNKNFKSKKVQKIVDILWNGCHTVIPPSIHQDTNKPYYWVGEDILNCFDELPEINDETLNKIIDIAKDIENKRKKVSKLSGDKDFYGRNVNLFNQAVAAIYKGKTEDEIINELINFDRSFHNPPYFSDPKENKNKISEIDFCKELVVRAKKNIDPGKINPKPNFEEIHEAIGVVKDKNKMPINNLDNILKTLDLDTRFEKSIWYDEFHNKIFSNLWGDKKEWSEEDDIRLLVIFQRDLGFLKADKNKIQDAVVHYAFTNKRNEPKEWMNSLVWDEVPRLQFFLSKAFGTEYNDYYEYLGKNWLISMAARIYKPGCKVDSMPIIEGPQGKFKSTALQIIGGDWFCEPSDEIGSKDFLQAIQGKLLVEIGELDGFYKKDATTIKKFITRQVDRFRPSYGRYAKDFPRQCVFVGTTNEDEYLKDSTGGRRFFPIRIKTIDQDYLIQNRVQLFAEAKILFEQGESWWDMPEDETKEMQESRRQSDAWEEIIVRYLESNKHKSGIGFTITEILNDCFDMAIGNIDIKSQHRVGYCLKSLGYKSKIIGYKKNRQRKWFFD